MLALTDIFISIIPLYKIEKEVLEKKLTHSMQKDERAYVIYELQILDLYEKFLKKVDAFLKVKAKRFCENPTEQHH